MVFAWLITQRQSFRENSTHLLPFKVRDTIRRRQSLRGGSREQENLENQEDGEDMQIVGVLELSATSQYDHLQDLSADEREQYYHWACRLKVDPAGLWRMHVENCHVFDGRWKLSTYCQRNVSKLYRRLEHLHAIGLTADVGELPAWAPDPHEDVITFGLCLPSGFIAKISSGAWDRLVLPSPFMHGPFGAPKRFQNSLEPVLAQAVASHRAAPRRYRQMCSTSAPGLQCCMTSAESALARWLAENCSYGFCSFKHWTTSFTEPMCVRQTSP